MPLNGITVSLKGRGAKWHTADDGQTVANEINDNEQIETLELSSNSLGVEAARPIATALQNHPELKNALFSDIFTTRDNTEIPVILKLLCDGLLSAGTRLTVLDLSDNAIGPQAIAGLSGFLSGEGCFQLKTLKLNNCGLGGAGITVAECLRTCHNRALRSGQNFGLETFVAGRNRLEDAGAIALSKAFKTIGTLRVVELPQNGITAKGIIALARGFAKNTNLRRINLSDNVFGRNGAIAMSKVICNMDYLATVDFSDCLCRRKGSLEIAFALSKKMGSLKELMLNGNEIDSPTAAKIIRMVIGMPHLQSVDLQMNSFGDDFEDLVAQFNDPRINFGDIDDDDGSRDGDTDSEPYEDAPISEEDEVSFYQKTHEKLSPFPKTTILSPPVLPTFGYAQRFPEEAKRIMERAAEGDTPTLSNIFSKPLIPSLTPIGAAQPSKPLFQLQTPPKNFTFSSAASMAAAPSPLFTPTPKVLSFKGRPNPKWDTVADGESVAVEIENTPQIDTLELSTNTISSDAAGPIARALKKHPELKKAAWSDIFTTRDNVQIPITLRLLCDSMLIAGTRLTVLDLSDNAIGPQAIAGLEGFLSGKGCFSLKELHLNNCGLGGAGKNVANCLVQCHRNALASGVAFKLEVFVAGRNRLENPGATALGSAFQTLGSLVEIRMPQNGIRSEGIIALASGLRHCPNLRILDLNDNTFKKNGTLAMAQIVGDMKNLEKLNFGDCLCGSAGAVQMVKMLVNKNSSIRELSLYGNEINAKAIFEIGTDVEKLAKVEKVQLGNNRLGNNFDDLKEEFPNVDFGEESDNEDSDESDDDDEDDDITAQLMSSMKLN